MFRPRRKPRKPDPRRIPPLKFAQRWPKRSDGLCRCGCGEKPQGRRQSWATQDCLDRALASGGSSARIRRILQKRDGGVCAECGLATDFAAQECRRWPRESQFASPAECAQARAETEALRAKFMALGFPPPGDRGCWWQADHIQPIEEGGANSLENLRTLCIRCHRRVTRQHAARRARRRRGMSLFPASFAEAKSDIHGLAHDFPNP